ncbi:MAG TPA: TraR/DksA C4-type zinc finger protein, partial [Candidatus Udaeobacter sp.]|nr:TraR/DksA C4-type zinc finger protein [Candidatus Udaeobacter sp.]
MAKSKKKNRSAVRKPRSAGKLHARKAKPKNRAREKKIARRSPKTNLEGTESPAAVLLGLNHREKKLDPFVRKQKQKLLQLRDAVVDSMAGVAQGTLRSRAEGSEASAFGMHQADAGSDAYDRDFALSLLSQEQDALYEIDEALKRIEIGTYGKCEMSGKPIPRARLEAIPFARFTVECQS